MTLSTDRTLGPERAAAMEGLLNSGLDVDNVGKMSALLAKNREGNIAITEAAETATAAAAAALAVNSPESAARSLAQPSLPQGQHSLSEARTGAAQAADLAVGVPSLQGARVSSSSRSSSASACISRPSVARDSDASTSPETQRASPLSPNTYKQQQQQRQSLGQTPAPTLAHLVVQDQGAGTRSPCTPVRSSSPDMDLLWSPAPQKAAAAAALSPVGLPHCSSPGTPVGHQGRASLGLQQLEIPGGSSISHSTGTATVATPTSVPSSHRGSSHSHAETPSAVPPGGELSSSSSRSNRQLGDATPASIRHHSAASSTTGPLSSRLKPSGARASSVPAPNAATAAGSLSSGETGQAVEQVEGGHGSMEGNVSPVHGAREQQQQPHRSMLDVGSLNRHSSAPRSPSPSRLATPSSAGCTVITAAAVVTPAVDPAARTTSAAAAGAGSHNAEPGHCDRGGGGGGETSSSSLLGHRMQNSMCGGAAERGKGSRLGSACSLAGEAGILPARGSMGGTAAGDSLDSDHGARCSSSSPSSNTGWSLESCRMRGSGIVFSRPTTPVKDGAAAPVEGSRSGQGMPKQQGSPSTTGMDAGYHQQQQQQQQGAPEQGAMPEDQQQQQQRTPELSSLYGLSVGAAVCMADLVRQVRGCHCGRT